jgi:hypothetical protein
MERVLIRPVLAKGNRRSTAFLGPDRVELLFPTRPVTEHDVAQRLRSVREGLTEFICHPGSLGAQFDGAGEQAVVTSRTVREAIAAAGVEVTSYRELAEGTIGQERPVATAPA